MRSCRWSEGMVSEELEKHLILNSNRFRTFEDARLEIMSYVEATFSLRIRGSKPSEAGDREHFDPLDVDANNSLASSKGKGHAVELIFKETAMFIQRNTERFQTFQSIVQV